MGSGYYMSSGGGGGYGGEMGGGVGYGGSEGDIEIFDHLVEENLNSCQSIIVWVFNACQQ